MFGQGISRQTHPTTISPIERLNCTASEAANTDTMSMTGCPRNVNSHITIASRALAAADIDRLER